MSRLSLASSLKNSLPQTFHHGYASAAYQIEGGFDQGGRGLSVWEPALEGMDNGDVACDSYHLWEEDVALLKQYGANSYRFSISWSRIIPLGGRRDPVNEEGIQYYSNLIDALLQAGITPFVTLFHWDLPLALQDRYAGFIASGSSETELYEDFTHFSKICFEFFGDRVKHWITLNEPQIFTMLTATSLLPDTFDMLTHRWQLARNLVMVHARAVDLYRRQFQKMQSGVIGITLNIEWVEGVDGSSGARDAAQRGMDLSVGIFADPIYLGRYNERGQKEDVNNIYQFSEAEWKLVAGSSDFFGLNHYSTRLATGVTLSSPSAIEQIFGDIETVTERDGKPIGHRGHNGHPFTVPWGFGRLLHHVRKTWTDPTLTCDGRDLAILVTENGYAEQDEAELPMESIINDTHRQEYFDSYICELVSARNAGVPIDGYFGWSLLDNLEWSAGYGPRFGVTYVDRNDGMKRTPKRSALLVRDIFNNLCA